MTFQEKVLHCLTQIPQGKVVTYAQIAEAIGSPGASRAVGNALHRNPNPDKYPCYKVVNAHGKLSCHYACGGLAAQKYRLEKDGIKIIAGRVDLSVYQAQLITKPKLI